MSEAIRVLGVSGSLRKASFNTALLRAAQELAPEGLTITIADIAAIPPYDEDVRAKGFPEAVQKLRDAIAAADALLFATPEYNFSMSGVLKNAIDWASRPPSHPFADKPMAIVGASGGMGGTMRAQYDLRRSAVFLDMHVLNKPEVFVRNAGEKFDPSGKLTDEPTRKVLADHLVALAKWTHRIRSTR
ncbi:MAG TPA: NADPH-dependent FMN reductase [Labilithrix sp.]|jgi:chromate reductase